MTINQVDIKRDDFENIETAWAGDLWDRRRLGEQLERYVDRLQCGAVLALDARWGEGKTWFVRHWARHLTDTDHNVIYLDAFANDYLDDPFLTIAAEISQAFRGVVGISDDDIKEFDSKTASLLISLMAVIPMIAAKASIHWIGLGGAGDVVKDVYEQGKEVFDVASDEIASKVKEQIEKKIENHHIEKQTIQDFKKELAQIASQLKKPLVFIIDELDRCRPDFAIRLIERIKHFFDIPKIVFVLVMDKTQFSNVVCHNYGYDKKISEEYLDKFIDFTVGLNVLAPDLIDNFKINIHSAFKSLGIDLSNRNLDGCIELIDFYARDKKLSKRVILKLASQFALLYSNEFDSNKNQLLIMFLLNPTFLFRSSTTLELLSILLEQMDNYIQSNKDDFEKYHGENYRKDSHTTVLMRNANFFHDELGILIFIQLVEYHEQLINSQKRFSAVSVRNLRATNNTDFYSGWKNYIFGGI